MLARVSYLKGLAPTASRTLHQLVINNEAKSSIFLAQDETYLVAYHPDKMMHHPYECTLPFPKRKKSLEEQSLIKTDILMDSYNIGQESPNMEQLQVITYTPRHVWYRNRGRELRKKFREMENDNIDRKGL